MSNSSIEGKLKGLQERLENEMRMQKEGGFSNQGAIGTPRPGSGRSRPKPPPIFPSNEILAFPPRSPQATETEHRMREVYKVSGKLNVEGVEYRSNIDDLQHLGELGSGTCGHVVKMLHKSSGAVIAVKQMRRSGNSEETKRILMDLDVVVRSHDCPYIVRCLGCFVTDADVWICMELMASCFDKLLKRLAAPIPEAILGKVTVATVNALSYLKDTHGVIHRDVKPSNILLDERGNVKLCDFGISGRLVDSKAKTRSAGCAAYMAPERIDPPDPSRPDYDIRADVWSLGISLVELATGVFPYRNCQNDFEVLTRVIVDAPPQLPEDSDFSPEFKSFVSQCLTKNYRQRPKYVKLLEHPFVVQASKNSVSVGDWYSSLPISGGRGLPTPTPTPTHTPRVTGNGLEPRNFVTTASHWSPEQVTPTPGRARWATGGAGGSSSQPASLEIDFSNHSPFPRRRTIDACASPPPPPVRRVSADNRWRPSPASSGNTSPMVLQRFYHQNQQRRSRVDLHSTPRHRSLSREHSAGRSPEPPPRVNRLHHHVRHDSTYSDGVHACSNRRSLASARADYCRRELLMKDIVIVRNRGRDILDNIRPNGSMEFEPPPLHERLLPPSPLLLSERLEEGRSRSLTRAELRNGLRTAPAPPSTNTPIKHHEDQANGSMEFEPPPLHERLLPPSPLLLSERLEEGRSRSLTRAELRNGLRTAPAPPSTNTPIKHHEDQGWLHSLAGLVKRRLSGYVKWHHVAARHHPHHNHNNHHRWGGSESWSVPASPLPPRAPHRTPH